MARQRNQFPRRSSPPNRTWAGAFDEVTVAAASTKVLVGSFSLSNPGIDETILRIAGVLSVRSDQAIADENQSGAFGMIVVSTVAITTGITVIPGPITDIGNDGWFCYVPFLENFEFITAAGFAANLGRRYEVASRAKRKNPDGFAVAMVVESTSGSHGFTLNTIIRLLSMVTGT